MAAKLRRELQTDVDIAAGHYGEFKVLVDGDTVVDGGAAAFLGIVPSARKVIDEVQARIGQAT